MKEEWKVIEDSPNYSVSSFGRFRNNRSGGETRKYKVWQFRKEVN